VFTAKTADAGAQTVLDVPAWPGGASPELKLTWAVYPPTGQGERSTRQLEVVARIGDAVRRFRLGAIQGALQPQNQSVCGDKQIAYKKMVGEVAKITFYVGGATTFAAKRLAPGMLAIESVAGSDGYCPTDDCDVRKTLVTIPIPEDARIVEALSDVQGPGREAPFACGETGTAASCKAGEVAAFDSETSKPICGKPCSAKTSECGSSEMCAMAYKSLAPTMGMSQARANELYVCRPRPLPSTSGSTKLPPGK